MLEIIKSIIEYIPTESIDEMLNTKIYSIVTTDIGNWKQTLEIENTITDKVVKSVNDEEDWSEIKFEVKTSQIKDDSIKKTNNSDEILKDILNQYEYEYKKSKNYLSFNKSKIKLNELNINILLLSFNIIAMNGRKGTPTVLIVPYNLYNTILSMNMGVNIIRNPLENYQNKIYVIRKDLYIHNQNYYLLTDKKIPTEREKKINKLLKQDNKEINYSILSVNDNNSIIIIEIE